LLAGAVLVLTSQAFAINTLARFRAPGEPPIVAGVMLGWVLLLLVASVIFGIRRVRYLRRDLATLRELRSELEPER
jgi:hypothetical protein